MSSVTWVYREVVDPPAAEPCTGTGLSVAGEDVDAPVIESGTGAGPPAADKGCADVDAPVVESGTDAGPSAADKGCADVDAPLVVSGTGNCSFVAEKWDKGDDSLGGPEPCKGAGLSNESCGGDPPNGDEYCNGVVPPRRLSDPVVTSRGTTGAAHTRLRMERTRRV